MKALIFNGRVVDLAQVQFPVADTMTWVDTGQTSVKVGDSYENGVFTPYTPLVVVPSAITPLQARKILRQNNLYTAVQSYLAGQSDEVQDEWEYALEIRRDNTTLLQAADALGLTSQQLDQMFIAAAQM